ncbi:hypothetical protein [Streptomyces chrestomyceticus]|uniref:hypothetical protein n=1 Tax=Streptomyces chrestomyceticus TaxID=68185 RepID=UPI0037B8C0B2
MKRSFNRPSAERPGETDYFVISTRWVASKSATRITIVQRAAGEREETTSIIADSGMDYYGFVADTTEELLDEGWEET